jgi:hypothetical protein
MIDDLVNGTTKKSPLDQVSAFSSMLIDGGSSDQPDDIKSLRFGVRVRLDRLRQTDSNKMCHEIWSCCLC